MSRKIKFTVPVLVLRSLTKWKFDRLARVSVIDAQSVVSQVVHISNKYLGGQAPDSYLSIPSRGDDSHPSPELPGHPKGMFRARV